MPNIDCADELQWHESQCEHDRGEMVTSNTAPFPLCSLQENSFLPATSPSVNILLHGGGRRAALPGSADQYF